MAFTLQEILYTLVVIKDKVIANKRYLDTLDEAIGDGDHGSEISWSFENAIKDINQYNFNDWCEIFEYVGNNIVSNCAGECGVLYGSALIKSSFLGKGKKELSLYDFRSILKVSIETIEKNGNCKRGDKTVLDGMIPIYEEVSYGIDNKLNAENVLKNALVECRRQVEKTKLLISKKGRASYLGNKSIGVQDPGATSCLIIFEGINDSYFKLRMKQKCC